MSEVQYVNMDDSAGRRQVPIVFIVVVSLPPSLTTGKAHGNSLNIPQKCFINN